MRPPDAERTEPARTEPERLAAIEAIEDPVARLARTNEVKRLTLPGEMGERFQAMAFQRGVDIRPLFARGDLSRGQALRGLVGDDPQLIREFLQAFRSSAARIAQEVEQAYRAGSAAKTVAAVHKLKSAARSVGAMALGDLCADMEQVGAAGQIDALALAFEHFKREMAATDQHLAELLSDNVQDGGAP